MLLGTRLCCSNGPTAGTDRTAREELRCAGMRRGTEKTTKNKNESVGEVIQEGRKE